MQEEANHRLQKICMNLKAIPDIGNAYMEYLSALIYVIYENYSNITDLLETGDIQYIVRNIERYLEIIRRKESSERLFRNISFAAILNEENVVILKRVITELNEFIFDLKSSKIELKNCFEYIILQAAQNSELTSKVGRFYTPTGLVKTMVKLLHIESHKSIYNPACASGNFITESVKDKEDMYVFGEEENISNYNICMTNLLLNGIKNKRIDETGLSNFPKVDYAISNPPFDLDGENDVEIASEMYLNYGVTPKTSTYVKYIIKMLNSIDDYGKMAIILPQGFLFKKNAVETSLRRKLIQRNYIDAIIRLPEKMFYDTKIPVIILTIIKRKHNKDVLFIDASQEYKSKRKTNILTKENQDKILYTYTEKKVIPHFSYIATLDEIEKNNYNLNINNYIKIKKDKVVIDYTEKERKVHKLEMERQEIQSQIEQILMDIRR